MASRAEIRARQFINNVCDRLGIARNSTQAEILDTVSARKAATDQSREIAAKAAAERRAQAAESAAIEQWANARKR